MTRDSKQDGGHAAFSPEAYDPSRLPDIDNDFVDEKHFRAFVDALAAPENVSSPSPNGLSSPPAGKRKRGTFIKALNDWRPVHQRVKKRKRRRARVDETREGYLYGLLKWPLLLCVGGWLVGLGLTYLLTRFYIYLYEHWVTWRGTRQRLRVRLQQANTYEDWVAAARELDTHLGNERWKTVDEYAYYDSVTVRRVRGELARLRAAAEKEESGEKRVVNGTGGDSKPNRDRRMSTSSLYEQRPVDELVGLVEACVKSNFVGFENPRLYSETYYGTKDLVQSFVDEVSRSLGFLVHSKSLDPAVKATLFRHARTNFGRTALCLSGGATFAYYHLGVARALLDADLLPQVLTGTSGGALVAALLATRTNDELRELLVPALAARINACHDDIVTWMRRWARTGARFDSVDWAQRCAWFTHGSLTFREAYRRTGRVLNVSCVPSDPHSPTILANHLTSPDCVVWSAVLASAAVPGILNPVVLMRKTKSGRLEPYSFGHKWKDGSLRTDIPLKALHLHFNVRFPVVSQVNPHVNLFFFSSRGAVGRPVTHRRGRGWRGGFLGSAAEQYLKLDLTKWLKVLRHLELLPRPLGQDWSAVWLQRFDGTVTIRPKSRPEDFWKILSDPSPHRLARMLRSGQRATFPALAFVANRARIERLLEEGRRAARAATAPDEHSASEDEDEYDQHAPIDRNGVPTSPTAAAPSANDALRISAASPGFGQAHRRIPPGPQHAHGLPAGERPASMFELRGPRPAPIASVSPKSPAPPSPARAWSGTAWLFGNEGSRSRRGSVLREIERQSAVFFDDIVGGDDGSTGDEDEEDEDGESGDDDDVYETGDEWDGRAEDDEM